MNDCKFIGNLTKDPVTATTQSGAMKCTFTIAVQRKYVGEDGVKKADFIPITCWRNLAEICAKYLKKGRKVAVACHVQTDTYTTDQGNSRMVFNFIADEVEFLSSGSSGNNKDQAEGAQQPSAPAAPQGGGFVQVDEEDLPF